MVPTSRFTVHVLPEHAPQCRLLDEGRETGLLLPGRDLEAQFAVGQDWLLFLTHDVPYEEGLEICLIGPDMRLADRVALAWPYSTGHLHGVTPRPPRGIAFRFFGGKTWVVEVLPRPRLHLPLLGDPRGVWPRASLRTRLLVRTETLH